MTTCWVLNTEGESPVAVQVPHSCVQRTLYATRTHLTLSAGPLRYTIKRYEEDEAKTLETLASLSVEELALFLYEKARSDIDPSRIVPSHMKDAPVFRGGEVYFKNGLFGTWRRDPDGKSYHLTLGCGAYLGAFPETGSGSLKEVLLLGGEEALDARVYIGARKFAEAFSALLV
jgi:hypothetical protein